MKGPTYWQPIPKEVLSSWYWDKLLGFKEIAQQWAKKSRPLKKLKTKTGVPSVLWIYKLFKKYGIPVRSPSSGSVLRRMKNRPVGQPNHLHTNNRPRHQVIYETYIGPIDRGQYIHHKDHVFLNNHPQNLEAISLSSHMSHHQKTKKLARIPIYEVYMRMAELIAKRSHHGMTKVGCLITSFDLTRVLSVGFNGNGPKLHHSPDGSGPGNSNLIHAEINALCKAGEPGTDRVAFITHSPCLMCAKSLAVAGIKFIFYRQSYRDISPLGVARWMGIEVCHYTKWATEKW